MNALGIDLSLNHAGLVWLDDEKLVRWEAVVDTAACTAKIGRGRRTVSILNRSALA